MRINCWTFLYPVAMPSKYRSYNLRLKLISVLKYIYADFRDFSISVYRTCTHSVWTKDKSGERLDAWLLCHPLFYNGLFLFFRLLSFFLGERIIFLTNNPQSYAGYQVLFFYYKNVDIK